MRLSRVLSAMLAGGLLAVGCGERPVHKQPAFELRDVVAVRLKQLRAELHQSEPSTAPAQLAEQAAGLVSFLTTAAPSMADAAFVDATAFGDSIVPGLLAVFHETERPNTERRAALGLLGAIKTPSAAAALAEIAGRHHDSSFRAVAAWKLEAMQQDLIIPALLRQLRYERDPEALAWMARSLAAQGNFAGVDALLVLAEQQGPSGQAQGHLAQLLSKVAAQPAFTSAPELGRTWSAGDPEQRLGLRPEPSAHWHLAVWTWIETLAEFQLRGVDDSRYILANLGPGAAREVAKALHDSNPYVRSHVAQALGRMGPRGIAAAAELAAALNDPILAPYAAEALASVCAGQSESDALTALVACTAMERAPGLRLSAARALGTLADPAAIPRLEELCRPPHFLELQQAATESLAALGQGQQVAERLIGYCENSDLDPGTSARALHRWLQRQAQMETHLAPEERPFTQALRLWDDLAPDAFVPASAQENAERLKQRMALVQDLLSRIEPSPPR